MIRKKIVNIIKKLLVIVTIPLFLYIVICIVSVVLIPMNKPRVLRVFNDHHDAIIQLSDKVMKKDQIYRLVNYNSNNIIDYFWYKSNVSRMINQYYTKSLIVMNTFECFDESGSIYKFENRRASINSVEFAQLLNSLKNTKDELLSLFTLLDKTGFSVLNSSENSVEFSYTDFIFSDSLDYYNGIVVFNGSLGDKKKTSYRELFQIENNIYYFIKDR